MSYLTGCNIAGTNTWNLLANAPTTNWSGITCSSDGKNVYACAGNASTSGYIYTSTDYGTNWNTITGASNTWSSIECNSNGIFGAAIASGSNNIYITTNWGATWAASESPALNWSGITVNSTGQYMNACVNGGLIYTATTFGNTWASTTTGNEAWSGIATDITGQYIVACVNGGNIWRSANYGILGSWSTTGPPSLQTWSCIASNTTGEYIVAGTSTIGGNIWISPTSGLGNIWYSNFSSPYSSWQNISVSSTGQYMSAIEQTGNIYVSSNYGQNWLQQTSYTNTWTAICMNYSGQYMYAGSDANIYAFSQTMAFDQLFKTIQSLSGPDTGFNIGGAGKVNQWINTNSPNVGWESIDCNSTGSFIIGCTNNVGYKGIWITSNYGSTWTNTYSTELNVSSIKCNNSGQYCACILNSQLLLSRDFGNTWNINTSLPITIANLDMNASGNLICCTNSGNTRITTNYGTTWYQPTGLNSPYGFIAMAISSTGQYIILHFGTTPTSAPQWFFASSNYGVTFRRNENLITPICFGTVMSASGQYIAMRSSTFIQISSNYGVSWRTPTTVSGFPRTFAMSSSGQYILYGVFSNSQGVYLSSNYGVSFTTLKTDNVYRYNLTQMSSSGMFYAVVPTTSSKVQVYMQRSDFSKSFESVNTGSSILVPASTPGFNYTLQKITTNTTFGQNVSSICISTSGQYILMTILNGTYGAAVSSNYGSTFTYITNISANNNSNSRVDMSSSGQMMYVSISSSSPGLYVSTNYGVGFNAVSTGSFTVSGTNPINTSPTGQYTITSLYNPTGSVWNIFISDNSGTSFLQKTLSNSSPPINVCVNYSGQYYGAVVGSQRVYISNNSGASFTFLQFAFQPNSIACSNTGQYFALTDTATNNIYISNNYGNSFYQSSSPSLQWSSIYINTTGQIIIGMSMTSGDNNIYISKNYGLTWDSIEVPGNLPIPRYNLFYADSNIRTIIYADTSNYLYMVNLSQELGSLFQSI